MRTTRNQVITFSLVHLILSIALFMFSFSLAMQRSFERDQGVIHSPGVKLADKIVHTSADIIVSPLGYCAFVEGDCSWLDKILPGFTSILLIPLNSLLWGYVLAAVISSIRKRRREVVA